MKKKYTQTLRKRPHLSTLIITLLVISQIISAYFIFKNREYITEDSRGFITDAINSSEEKRYIDPVIDIGENRVYIPEARIYFPLNSTTRHLRYDYNDSFDQPRLSISMRGVVGHQLQSDPPSCDQMLSFSREVADSTNLLSEIEPTKDGFRYIYRHPKCESYYGTVSDDLAETAKEIKSY